jgi:hypothetical protein
MHVTHHPIATPKVCDAGYLIGNPHYKGSRVMMLVDLNILKLFDRTDLGVVY